MSATKYSVEIDGKVYTRSSKREYTHVAAGACGVYSWHGTRKAAETALNGWLLFYRNCIAASKGLPLEGKGYHNSDVPRAELELNNMRIVEINA